MELKRAGSQPSARGPAEWFTGSGPLKAWEPPSGFRPTSGLRPVIQAVHWRTRKAA